LGYPAEDVKEQLEAAKVVYAHLSEQAESDTEDMSIVLCLESTDSHIKDLVRELRLADENASAQKILFADGKDLPRVNTLSEVKTYFHLMGYYFNAGLEKTKDSIVALKRDMGVLDVRGENVITPEEELAVLEDVVLLGYWKAFYDNA